MKKEILLRRLCVAIPAILFAQITSADLIGDTIGGQMDLNNLGFNRFNSDINDSSPTVAIVEDPGVEFSHNGEYVTYSADFDANTLTIRYQNNSGSSNQITRINMNFTDLNYGGDIVGIQIINNDFKQTNELNISFSMNGIHIDLPWMNLNRTKSPELKLLIVTAN